MIGSNPKRLFLSLAITAICTTSVAAQSVAPVAVIRFEPYQGNPDLPTVHASVNGHDGVFAFDSGEGVSMITPDFAHAIGCKPWGQVTGFQMNGGRIDAPRCDDVAFEAAGQRFAVPSVIVFDFMKKFKPDQPRLQGSLGFDLFAGRAITLQLSGQQIVIESAASLAARIAKGTEVPIRIVRDAQGLALTVDVGVPTPEGMAWMELDSGGGESIIIGKHIAPLFKLDP
ncbi:MAG: retropepsin-like aspartic protease, partial [Gemmatimonadaceae bacterium]